MKKIIRQIKFLSKKEVFKYLLAGILTTLVYMISRLLSFEFIHIAMLAAILANVIAIIFAFFINDSYVFEQKGEQKSKRFIQFFIARLSTLILDSILAFVFVEKYPELIGRFVNDNLSMVNSIETVVSQIFILVSNYLLSKFVIFKKID